MVNTGSLTAPGGLINLKAVPDAGVVRLEQAGMVLGLEIEPLATDGSALGLNLLPETLTPLDLPQLLTGGNLHHATALVVNADGTVSLRGSTQPLPTGAGDIALAGTVNVDALILGDGGEARIIAEDELAFWGEASARGGNLGGNGGLIDLSGKETLNLVSDWYNRVDLAAPQGGAGTLVFDPNDITIAAGSGPPISGSPTDANTIYANHISTFLNNRGSLVIQTTGSGGNGDITVSGALSWSANQLTLLATRNLQINAGLTITGTGALHAAFGQGTTDGSGSSYTVADGVSLKIPLPTGS